MNNAIDYSVKGAKERNVFGGRKMQTGIHSKVKFLPAEVEKTWVEFKWQDSKGDVQNKRIFFPDPANYPASMRKDKDGKVTETQAQADQRQADDKVRDMADYLELCYTPQEVEEKVKGNTFEQLCHVVVEMLNKKIDEFFVNLKVIPTSDLQYSEVPKFQGGYIELW